MLHLERRVLETSFLFLGIYATELLQCDTYMPLNIMVYIYTVLRNAKNSKHGNSVECPKILNNQFQTVMKELTMYLKVLSFIRYCAKSMKTFEI